MRKTDNPGCTRAFLVQNAGSLDVALAAANNLLMGLTLRLSLFCSAATAICDRLRCKVTAAVNVRTETTLRKPIHGQETLQREVI